MTERLTKTNSKPVRCKNCEWRGRRVYVEEGEGTKARPDGWGPCPQCNGILVREELKPVGWTPKGEEKRLAIQKQMKELS